MAKLWLRRAIVTVGISNNQALRIDNRAYSAAVDLSFRVTKTLKKEPNKASISLYNLSESVRARIAALKTIPVELEAGYDEETTLIFRGDMRQSQTVRNGADIVTTIQAGDGEKKHRTSRVSKAYGRGASFKEVIEGLAASLGIGKGNIELVSGQMRLEGVSDRFAGGISLTGSAAKQLNKLVRSAGYEYSVQDGQIQIIKNRGALPGIAKKLHPDNGLIGSPTRDTHGIVKADIMMIGDIFPGRSVDFDQAGNETEGVYRIERAEYTGDTRGGTWGIKIECREVNG